MNFGSLFTIFLIAFRNEEADHLLAQGCNEDSFGVKIMNPANGHMDKTKGINLSVLKKDRPNIQSSVQ